MNNERYCNVGKNIKCLRNSYGETIVDLAFALGLNSPSTITNYEKGTNIPTRDVLLKIADHYRITIDKLVNGDFSTFQILSVPLEDKEKMTEMAEIMFPIVCSESAMLEPCFKKGYERHVEIYRKLRAGIEYTEAEFDNCIDAYTEAYEKHDTPEATANLMWWLLFFGVALSEKTMAEGYKELEKRNIDKQMFLKYYYLKDCDEDSVGENEDLEKERTVFLQENEEVIVTFLKELGASPKWYKLAEYYSALRYCLGVIYNNKSEEQNNVIGEEMMLSIAVIGNPYAIAYLNKGKECRDKISEK